MLFFFLYPVSRSSRRTHYWARPSQNSGRAAFPHPALHAANHLTNLCVSVSFLLEINFLIISISKYWISFSQRYRHMQLPSLLRHYPHPSVIWSCPTTCSTFAILPIGCLAYHILLMDVDDTGSPLLTWNPCIAWTGLRHRRSVWNLTISINPHVGFCPGDSIALLFVGISVFHNYPYYLVVYA